MSLTDDASIATVSYTAKQINELIFSANYVCDKHEFVQRGGDPDRLALAVARLRHAVDMMGKPEGGANG